MASIGDKTHDPEKLKRKLQLIHGLDKVFQANSTIAERHPKRLVGMRPARMMAPIFVSNDPRDIVMSREMLQGGVYGLMLVNIAWLHAHPETPDLYDANVVYKPERRRVDSKTHRATEYGEDWQTIPWVIYRGYGDCEDLGAWRSAELRVKYHIAAEPFVKIRHMPMGQWRAHVVVKWPTGQLEDPSAKLGMYTYTY